MSSIFLLEDTISSDTVSRLFSLQPHYIGGLQTAALDGGSLVPEDKVGGNLIVKKFIRVSFYNSPLDVAGSHDSRGIQQIILSIHGAATTELTLSSMRALYCKMDADMTAALVSSSSLPLSFDIDC